MKVIGLNENGDYIAIVTHGEIEKCYNKYSFGARLDHLKVGQEFDIGGGYNFYSDINNACRNMESASKSFASSQKTMMDFALMVSKSGEC